MYSSYTHTRCPSWSNTSSCNHRRLQISQSKCLRVIGNFPRRTPISRLHTTLNVTPIRDFIYHLTTNFFDRCPAHPNHLVRSIGNYSLADLHQQYKHIVRHPRCVFINYNWINELSNATIWWLDICCLLHRY